MILLKGREWFEDWFFGPLEGRPYELIRLSVPTSVRRYVGTSVTSFSGNLLVLSEVFRSDRNLETEKVDRHGFSRKISFCPKMDKEPKWGQNVVFLSFHEKLSLLCAGSNPKWKTLQFPVALCKLLVWENSASQFRGQNALIQSNCRILSL